MNPLELRGNDRVFQVDRDTILIYTGIHLEDFRPFARIGAGIELPSSIVNLIENVLLPERHVWNVGMEEMWLRNSIEAGVSKIIYVGNKEMLNNINKYFDLETYFSNGKKTERLYLPVEYKVYQHLSQKEIAKDKASIIYMHTGDFQVLVSGSRVLDSGNYFRARLTIDKEYSFLKRILEKLPKERAKEKFSFFLFPGEQVSCLLNFNGILLMVNPPMEMHYRLFEMHIDPDRVSMAITSSPYQPGFVEIFRRADVLQKEIAVSYPDLEKLSLLKKIYYYSRPKFFTDGSTLPFARYVNYYESKTKSHFALTFRTRDDVEVQMKLLFPFLKEKENKSFDYIKAPFDIEFLRVNHKKDIYDLQTSNYFILIQGEISDKNWANIRLKGNFIPALFNSEFRLHQIVALDEIFDYINEAFKDTVFGEYIINLATKIVNFNSVDELISIKDELYLIRTQPLPNDTITLFNLAETLKLLYHVASYNMELPKDVDKLFLNVMKRFSFEKIKIKDLLSLKSPVDVDLFVKAGEIVSVYLKESKPLWNIHIQYPPDPGNAIELEKEYRKYLKEQHKLIDKGLGTQNERQLLEFLEKLLEERIFYNEQRNRLGQLLEIITPSLEALTESMKPKGKKVPFHMKLPYWLRKIVEMLKIPDLINVIEMSIEKIKIKRFKRLKKG
ncbi:MAG: hypothetical protein RMI35_06260 [Leptospiraceae bacterium]|nr:hypothetical protein [Leptospiraceae bacterium]